jgi:hypothetical protein
MNKESKWMSKSRGENRTIHATLCAVPLPMPLFPPVTRIRFIVVDEDMAQQSSGRMNNANKRQKRNQEKPIFPAPLGRIKKLLDDIIRIVTRLESSHHKRFLRNLLFVNEWLLRHTGCVSTGDDAAPISK